MARVRSPGYPYFSLSDAIEYARKVHEEDRQHPVSREVAAQHIGFTGNNGASDRALSSLMHYGLAEKASKGEIRTSDLALRIIHPQSVAERRAALSEAAFNPDLFRDLRERYPGSPPSQSSLASYLSRLNFAAVAIGPAAKAYLETCYFLQREGAYESAAQEEDEGAHSAHDPVQESAPVQNQSAPNSGPNAVQAITSPLQPPAEELKLNEPNLSIRGGTVRVEALLDLDGLSELEEQLKALKMLLKRRKPPMAPADAGSGGSGEPNHLEVASTDRAAA